MPPTELLDLQPICDLRFAFRNESYEALYKDQVTQFNPIQTQTFNNLYNTNENILIGAPSSSGKTLCAEIAILRLFDTNPDGRYVYQSYKEPQGITGKTMPSAHVFHLAPLNLTFVYPLGTCGLGKILGKSSQKIE